MKSFIIASIILAAVASGAAYSQATIKEVRGKVEVRAAGASAWSPAAPGMSLARGAIVSTGFNSQALLDLGASTVTVRALTRMTLEELIVKEGSASTSLNLRVGKLRADVKSEAGLAQNFKVKSPISTAAVRGTAFDFDGDSLEVIRGAVAFSNSLGQTRTVGQGESSRLGGGEQIKPAELEALTAAVAALASELESIEDYDVGQDGYQISLPPEYQGSGFALVRLVSLPQ